MDADQLIIGARYFYRTLGGEKMTLIYTGHLGENRYVFHTQTRKYRFVLHPDAIADRMTESK